MLECGHNRGACTICFRCPTCGCNHDGIELASKLLRQPGRPVKNKASPFDSESENEEPKHANKKRRITRTNRTGIAHVHAARITSPIESTNLDVETGNVTIGKEYQCVTVFSSTISNIFL